MIARPLARKLVAVFLLTAPTAGCGDSLSSLDGVKNGVHEVYNMHLQPDYGPRGKTVKVTVTDMDEELEAIRADYDLYPTEISFGAGTHLKTFGTNDHDQFQIEIAISPLADKGKREPYLIFSVGDLQKLVEVRGSFWIAE